MILWIVATIAVVFAVLYLLAEYTGYGKERPTW